MSVCICVVNVYSAGSGHYTSYAIHDGKPTLHYYITLIHQVLKQIAYYDNGVV